MNQRPGGENLHIPLQIPGDAQGLSSHNALLLIYYYLSTTVAIARARASAWAAISCGAASGASPPPIRPEAGTPGLGWPQCCSLLLGKYVGPSLAASRNIMVGDMVLQLVTAVSRQIRS